MARNAEEIRRESSGAVSFLLALPFGLSVAGLALWVDPWSPTIAVALFGIATWAFYRAEPLFLYLALPFVFHWTWCLLSLRYLEGGAYISEQFTYGELSGATARFGLLALVFLAVVTVRIARFARDGRLADPYATADRPARAASFARYAQLSVAGLLAALLITGLVYGFPILTGQSRFAYWPTTPGLDRLVYLMPVVALTLGVAQHLVRGRRNIVLLLAGIGVLVLFSDKFSGPLSSILYFAMGYFTARRLDPQTKGRANRLGRAVLVAPLAGVLLAATTVYGYAAIDGKETYEVREAITSRALSLQGHVYYGIDRRVVVDKTDTVEPGDFFAVNDEPRDPAGLVRLMYEVSDPGFVSAMRASGIRFTNGYPAIAVASFGFLGALGVQVAAGLLFALFAAYLAIKIARLDFFGLGLAGVYLGNILTNALMMGEVYYLYRPLGLVLLVAMVLEHLASSRRVAKLGGAQKGAILATTRFER